MKRILLILSLILIITGCTVQNNIKKVEIKESGYNINVLYDPIDDEISKDGVSYKITPISPDELNTFFIQENTHNGKFEYSHYEASRDAYFLFNEKENKENDIKTNEEFLYEGLDWLLENNRISRDEFLELSELIANSFNEDDDQPTTTDFDRIIVANPYYLGNKYLNVFELDILNSTDSYKEFSGKISVEIGDQVLTALDDDQILELLELNGLYNQYKHKNLERINLKGELMIPPNSNFIKYFATLPIDYNNEVLSVSLSSNDEKAYWDIIKDKTVIDELYTYYVLDLEYVDEANSYMEIVSYSGDDVNGRKFNLFISGNSFSIIDGNELYVDQDNLKSEIEIFTITLSNDMVYYGRNNFIANDFINDRNKKRETVKIELSKIKKLKGNKTKWFQLPYTL